MSKPVRVVYVGRQVPATVKETMRDAGELIVGRVPWQAGHHGRAHPSDGPDVLVVEWDGVRDDAIQWTLPRLRRDHPHSLIVGWMVPNDDYGARVLTDWELDDYITPQMPVGAVTSKLRALVRRARRERAQRRHVLGDVEWETETPGIRVAGVPVALTFRELALFNVLARSPNRVVPRDALTHDVWELFGSEPESNVLAVTVNRLRAKLRRSRSVTLVTVRGTGYRITVSVGGEPSH